MLGTTTFVENSDLSTVYLGKIDITRASNIKAQEKIPISEQGDTIGKLLDGTECKILLDTGDVQVKLLMMQIFVLITKICF